MAVEIRKVETKNDMRAFIDFHYDLYKGNPYDVPTLFIDDQGTFDRKKNAAFDFCDAQFFLAYKDGKVAGRVAGIINRRANEKWQTKDVRFGWIDFIDDQEVSTALLKAVGDWGKSQGMTDIVGPLGFTDFDPEGMLIEGFDRLGTMATIYNYPYYPKHIEQMGGWVKDNDYVEYFLEVPEKMPEKYAKIAQLVEKRYNLHVMKLTKNDLHNKEFIRSIFHLINDTYSGLYGFVALTDRQIDQYVEMYTLFLDLDFISVIVDGNKDNALAGVGITVPSLAHALQKCHRGRLLPFGWLHVLRALKFHKTEGVDLELVGFLPEYRAKGANALLFADLIPRYQRNGIKWGETQVEMENNKGVQGQWDILGPTQHKRRRCYRKKI